MAAVYFEIDVGSGPVFLEQRALEANSAYEDMIWNYHNYKARLVISEIEDEIFRAEKRQDDETILFLSKFLSECRRIPEATIRIYD